MYYFVRYYKVKLVLEMSNSYHTGIYSAKKKIFFSHNINKNKKLLIFSQRKLCRFF